MTQETEVLIGHDNSGLEHTTLRTCFTEIRLSQAIRHAETYGLLGIGVDRKFILDRLGGPVHYVRNHSQEAIVGNYDSVFKHLTATKASRDLISSFGGNICFLKAMSDKDTDNYRYLDEAEWRIVHTYKMQHDGKIMAHPSHNEIFTIPLSPDDIKVIVFPNNRIRETALKHDRIAAFVHANKLRTVMLTLEQCAHF